MPTQISTALPPNDPHIKQSDNPVTLSDFQRKYLTLVVAIGIFTLGSVMCAISPTLNSLIFARLRPVQTSSGNSLTAVNQQLSISFGIVIGATLINLLKPVHGTLAQVQHAFSVSFIVLGVMTILAGLYFLRLHPRDGRGMY